MVLCLTSARFNQKADILRAEPSTSYVPDDPADPEAGGHWDTTQEPDSGEIIRKWVSASEDNPSTPEDETHKLETFKCIARGIIDGGIRVAGTTERFSDLYEAVDYVKISFPANVVITRRDKVTNIRDKRGRVLWKEEERSDRAATVFNVVGVTPIIDPFGTLIENTALLERAENQ